LNLEVYAALRFFATVFGALFLALCLLIFVLDEVVFETAFIFLFGLEVVTVLDLEELLFLAFEKELFELPQLFELEKLLDEEKLLPPPPLRASTST
jgi:hypothetical protein